MAVALGDLGDTYMEIDQPKEALLRLERALAIYAQKGRGFHPFFLADARRDTAKALWNADGDRKRAVALAIQARDAYAGSPSSEYARHALAVVEKWLAAHGGK